MLVGAFFIASRRNSLSQQLSSVIHCIGLLWTKCFVPRKPVDLIITGLKITFFIGAECGCNCPDHYNPLKGLCCLPACCQPGVAIFRPQILSVAAVWFPALGVCAWRGSHYTVIMPELLIFM